MAEIKVGKNETLDSALRRFKRATQKAGILSEVRKREHYEKPSVARKKKSEAARKRKTRYLEAGCMSIKDQLTADMKQAMKDREAGKLRLNVIRMVRANIKNVEINDKKELTDDEVLAVLMKEVKMRQDSLEEFQKAGRDELVAQAKEEIAILKKYLPEALGDDELKAIVAEVIAAVGATSPKDMGKVMPAVMAKTKGRADGKRINAIVRELLK